MTQSSDSHCGGGCCGDCVWSSQTAQSVGLVALWLAGAQQVFHFITTHYIYVDFSLASWSFYSLYYKYVDIFQAGVVKNMMTWQWYLQGEIQWVHLTFYHVCDFFELILKCKTFICEVICFISSLKSDLAFCSCRQVCLSKPFSELKTEERCCKTPFFCFKE